MAPVEFLTKRRSHEKTSDSRLRDSLQINWSVLFRNAKVWGEMHTRDKVLELKKTRDIRTKCVAGLDPGSIKKKKY